MRVSSHYMEEKNKKDEKKADHRDVERNSCIEKMAVMENRKSVTLDNFFQIGCDKYLWYLKTKYFQVFVLF